MAAEHDDEAAPAAAGRVRARLLGGGSLVLGADALQLPAAILLAAYLGRRLGVEGLALYLLAANVVTWVEVGVGSLYSRASVQLISETRAWRPVASLVLRWHAVTGLVVAVVLASTATPIERLLDVDRLGALLRLFALELPLFALARVHTHVLVGLGRFRGRAACSLARWVSRLAATVLLVEAGFGVRGAVLGSIASTAIELAVARRFVRPPIGLSAPAGLSRRLLGYSLPLFAHGLSLQLFHRLGLLLLVPLGGSLAAAGVYGAAQNLLQIRRMVGQSLTPLLLSSLSQLRRDGHREDARALARDALGWIFYPLPLVATVAGAGREVMVWMFGGEFADGGPMLTVLLGSVPAFFLLSVATAILVSEGRPRVPVALTAPMLPVAAAGMAWAVPRAGGLGAAAVTSATALLSASVAVVVLKRLQGLAPRPATVARCLLASAVAFLAAGAAPFDGWWLAVELPAIALAALGLLVPLGELRPEAVQSAALALRRLVTGRRAPGVAAGSRNGDH
jgi:O-antigen/teichoic acid export membrane protein